MTDRKRFYRVGGSWFRRSEDPGDFPTMVLSPSDLSRDTVGIHGNAPGSEYDARCSCCYLGFAHSLDLHRHSIGTASGEGLPCVI